MQEALLHKYHFNFLLLLNFSQWEWGGGVREVVQLYIGVALAVTRGCLAHHIHWTLKKCNDPSCLSGEKKRMLHQIYVWSFL